MCGFFLQVAEKSNSLQEENGGEGKYHKFACGHNPLKVLNGLYEHK